LLTQNDTILTSGFWFAEGLEIKNPAFGREVEFGVKLIEAGVKSF